MASFFVSVIIIIMNTEWWQTEKEVVDSINFRKENTMAKKKKKGKKKVEVKPKGVDRFGSKLSSNRAKIHSAIGKKPQTMKQLRDKAGIGYSMGEHLNLLVDAKLIKKSSQGYYLKQK